MLRVFLPRGNMYKCVCTDLGPHGKLNDGSLRRISRKKTF